MRSRGLLLAIDQGTTNTKAVLVGTDGRPVFVASAPVSVTHPQSDWVEQDPMALWASVVQAVAACVKACRWATHRSGGDCESAGDGGGVG